MHDIFISYSREDRSHAKRLAEAFESQKGWSVWWDVQLRSGEIFPRKIQEIINSVFWQPTIQSDMSQYSNEQEQHGLSKSL